MLTLNSSPESPESQFEWWTNRPEWPDAELDDEEEAELDQPDQFEIGSLGVTAHDEIPENEADVCMWECEGDGNEDEEEEDE